ncbi:hypothetical protein FALBO_16483, partial [Fusarium albosuccineum]
MTFVFNKGPQVPTDVFRPVVHISRTKSRADSSSRHRRGGLAIDGGNKNLYCKPEQICHAPRTKPSYQDANPILVLDRPGNVVTAQMAAVDEIG